MPSHGSQFLPAIEEIARMGGDCLMKHFRRLSGYEKKGAIDLLTIADKESEAAVVAEITRRFPDHTILAEEGGTLGAPDSEYLWVIDPLDGTTNFAHGLRIFAVSIGLLHRGEPIAGVVFAPALDELYAASLGGGATRNGAPIHVSKTAALDDSLIVTGFPYTRRELADVLTGVFKAVMLESQGMVRFGAASWDFASIAAGQLDGFYEWGLRPWDMAAGILLVREAGGTVTGLLPGERFDLNTPRAVATNGLIHGELQDAMLRGGASQFP